MIGVFLKVKNQKKFSLVTLVFFLTLFVLPILKPMNVQGAGIDYKATYTGASTVENVKVNGIDYVKIKFTSSGTWTVPASVTSADVFLVGGGGGGSTAGSGGGYTKTKLGVTLTPGENINAVIGKGGSAYPGEQGGTSSFGTYTAAGGYPGGNPDGSYYGAYANGGNGGSGGGATSCGGGDWYGGNGSSNGGNGNNAPYGGTGGTGQGYTTREFGETDGTLYAGGGGGYAYCPGGAGGGGNAMSSAAANTGGGAGGGNATSGGSGIVIVRFPKVAPPTGTLVPVNFEDITTYLYTQQAPLTKTLKEILTDGIPYTYDGAGAATNNYVSGAQNVECEAYVQVTLNNLPQSTFDLWISGSSNTCTHGKISIMRTGSSTWETIASGADVVLDSAVYKKYTISVPVQKVQIFVHGGFGEIAITTLSTTTTSTTPSTTPSTTTKTVYMAKPIFMVPVNTQFTINTLGEFEGNYTSDSDSLTATKGTRYTKLQGKFTSEGLKELTIGTDKVPINFYVIPKPTITNTPKVKFIR